MGGGLEVGHAGEESVAADGLLQHGQGEALRRGGHVVDAGGGHKHAPLFVVDEVFVVVPGALEEAHLKDVQGKRDRMFLSVRHVEPR